MGLAILAMFGIGLGLAFRRRSALNAVPGPRSAGAARRDSEVTAAADDPAVLSDSAVLADRVVLADLDGGWSHRLGRGVRRWGQLVGRAGSTAPMFREPYSEGGW